ncbi:hypothetical protein [Rathayibacter sp. AY1F9]|uniref:hypothetical protein n=1 Tax=Rathayibacter sp. AY1F9 TaxID=2080563 RepID=UPI000CE88874|nr:hypothetical protein [Rathayibacter sp. AY1F9]PPH27808.1 hypothetical protein C5C37_12320 [Rathayibacter sp. AY1F9]
MIDDTEVERTAWAAFEKRDALRVVARVGHFCELFEVTPVELCRRLALVGWPVPVNTMLGILRGKRRSISTSEVTAFAAALGVSTLVLLAPVAPLMSEKDEPVEVLPGVRVHPVDLVNSNFLGLGEPVGTVAPPDSAALGSGNDLVQLLASLPGIKWSVWNKLLTVSGFGTRGSLAGLSPEEILADEWVIKSARQLATATALLRATLDRVPEAATGARSVDRWTKLALDLQLESLDEPELVEVAYKLSLEASGGTDGASS